MLVAFDGIGFDSQWRWYNGVAVFFFFFFFFFKRGFMGFVGG